MRFYYQYDSDGWIGAVVKSDNLPVGRAQIASDTALQHGLKRFDTVAKKISFYKTTYNDSDEITGVVKNTDIADKTIKDSDIFKI